MIRRPPRSTPLYSSAASDVYKRQPQSSTERPQARPDNRKPDANIGCTVGVVYERDGSKNQKEARRKKQTLGTFGESWGASGEPFGETWGRLWGDSESVFLTKHA